MYTVQHLYTFDMIHDENAEIDAGMVVVPIVTQCPSRILGYMTDQ